MMNGWGLVAYKTPKKNGDSLRVHGDSIGGMGQQSLIYGFVARGTVILSEYTEFTGNFTSIAAQCLQKLPATNNKFTYNCNGHTFNYLVADRFTIEEAEKKNARNVADNIKN